MNVQAQTPKSVQRVRLSLDVSPELHTTLKVAAARRRLSMSDLLHQLLESSLALLGEAPGNSLMEVPSQGPVARCSDWDWSIGRRRR